MKFMLFTAFFVLLITSKSAAQPKFSDYPSRGSFRGKPARVILTGDRLARAYRTRLRETAAAGPNFAGYYAMGTWGCGSPCLMAGMVDLRTGRVFWPPNPEMMVFDISYRADSRLFIVNPREVLEKDAPNGPPNWIGGKWPPELFFVWNGTRFIDVTPKPKDAARRSVAVQAFMN